MGGKRVGSKMHRHIFGVLIACGVFAGAISFITGVGVENLSQVAVGAASDAMCMGGADAKCQCGKGLKDGKCDPNKKGGGKIGCECKDITSGDEAASGKCAAVGKCKADKADGKPPELPKLPEMPKPPEQKPKEPMQPNCPPKTATSTASATTTKPNDSASAIRFPNADPNCQENFSGNADYSAYFNPFGNSQKSSTSESDTDAGFVSKTSSYGSSVWKNLLTSLGFGSGSEEEGGTGTDSAEGGGADVQKGDIGTVKSKGSGKASTTAAKAAEFGVGSTFSFSSDLGANTRVSDLNRLQRFLAALRATLLNWLALLGS